MITRQSAKCIVSKARAASGFELSYARVFHGVHAFFPEIRRSPANGLIAKRVAETELSTRLRLLKATVTYTRVAHSTIVCT